jgi:hypothetical protein
MSGWIMPGTARVPASTSLPVPHGTGKILGSLKSRIPSAQSLVATPAGVAGHLSSSTNSRAISAGNLRSRCISGLPSSRMGSSQWRAGDPLTQTRGGIPLQVSDALPPARNLFERGTARRPVGRTSVSATESPGRLRNARRRDTDRRWHSTVRTLLLSSHLRETGTASPRVCLAKADGRPAECKQRRALSRTKTAPETDREMPGPVKRGIGELRVVHPLLRAGLEYRPTNNRTYRPSSSKG